MRMPGLVGLIQKVEQAGKQVGQGAGDSAAQRAAQRADYQRHQHQAGRLAGDPRRKRAGQLDGKAACAEPGS